MLSDAVKDYLSAIGRKGGKVKVRKGLACLSAAKRREIARLGGKASRKK